MRITIASIQRATAEHYGLPLETMNAPGTPGGRQRINAWPRQMAMLLSRRMTKHSKVRIGGRDHSTIIYGCRKARRRCLSDRAVLAVFCEIRAQVLTNA
jgi:chromosomal replication initiator protein